MTVRSAKLRSPLPISPARIALAAIALVFVVLVALIVSVEISYASRIYPGSRRWASNSAA